MNLNDTVQRIILDVASGLGYMVYQNVLVLHGRMPRITVKIDHNQGISHYDCERFSKELSHTLDSRQLLHDYILEVSSPGIQRELRTIDDFIRFKGAPVKGIYEDGHMKKTFEGRVANIEGEAITIAQSKNEITLVYSQIVKANLDY